MIKLNQDCNKKYFIDFFLRFNRVVWEGGYVKKILPFIYDIVYIILYLINFVHTLYKVIYNALIMYRIKPDFDISIRIMYLKYFL